MGYDTSSSARAMQPIDTGVTGTESRTRVSTAQRSRASMRIFSKRRCGLQCANSSLGRKWHSRRASSKEVVARKVRCGRPINDHVDRITRTQVPFPEMVLKFLIGMIDRLLLVGPVQSFMLRPGRANWKDRGWKEEDSACRTPGGSRFLARPSSPRNL